MPYKDPEKRKKQATVYTKAYRERKKNDPEWIERQRQKDRERYHDHPNLKRAQARQWRQDNQERHMVLEARRRSKKRGWDFDLEASDVVIPEVCPVLGIPLFRGYAEGKRTPGPNSPSLDRVNPILGYVKGNVRVISWKANRIKTDATAQELELVLAYVRRVSP